MNVQRGHRHLGCHCRGYRERSGADSITLAKSLMVLEVGVIEGRKYFANHCIEGTRPNILQTPAIDGTSISSRLGV